MAYPLQKNNWLKFPGKIMPYSSASYDGYGFFKMIPNNSNHMRKVRKVVSEPEMIPKIGDHMRKVVSNPFTSWFLLSPIQNHSRCMSILCDVKSHRL